MPLVLYWVQTGPGDSDWKLRSRCAKCRREIGLVKQTQEALKAAPPKVPQLFFDFGLASPQESKAQEVDPT